MAIDSIDLQQKYLMNQQWGMNVNPIAQPTQQEPVEGISSAGYVGGVEAVKGVNPFIPQNKAGYVAGEDGTQISLGQDGYGLAHRNASEYKLHLIA